MKKLIFTVTNDLNYDQRMIRICTSLVNAGYDVLLIGRKKKDSAMLRSRAFRQKRLHCFFQKGKWFYAEYNVRLFLYLLFRKADLICAIDLDTILPCYRVSKLKGIKRVYDAHELFCEMKEVVSRPTIYKAWKRIEQRTVPKFSYGYTVSSPIAGEFKKMYAVNYAVIMNAPVLSPLVIPQKKERYILYQGSVNEGRSFETLIPAMKEVNSKLVIAGDGNFMEQAKQLVKDNKLEDKIVFAGKIFPDELKNYTQQAYIGITLFENKGLSNYYSLGNRFFDYIHAGIPQLCVDFPAYRELNKEPVAILIDDPGAGNISKQLNQLLNDDQLYKTLQANCISVRKKLNWQNEEKKLVQFYQDVFKS